MSLNPMHAVFAAAPKKWLENFNKRCGENRDLSEGANEMYLRSRLFLNETNN